MAANEIHKNDTTTIRRVMYDGDDVVDISSATVKQIKLYKPSGEMSGWTGHSDKQTFQVYDNL